jgi:osmotically-inducible protein OsmY
MGTTSLGNGVGNPYSQQQSGAMSQPTQTIAYQTNLRVRFEQPPPAVAASTTVSQLQTRLNTSPRLRRLGNINVELSGKTARLMGAVSSERDRQLARGLALLEPGVSSVEDELVVVESSEPLPPPAAADSASESAGRS